MPSSLRPAPRARLKGWPDSDDGQKLSYAELNARSNELAHSLQARGIGPEDLVAVCLERSLYLLIALLSIWKAGAGLSATRSGLSQGASGPDGFRFKGGLGDHPEESPVQLLWTTPESALPG